MKSRLGHQEARCFALSAVLLFSCPIRPCGGAEKAGDEIDYTKLSSYGAKEYEIEFGSEGKYAVPGDTVIDAGSRKQLFIDGMLIESSRGVQLTMNPPHQTGELLLTNDQPWETGEGAYIHLYSSVLKEGDKIRMWYGVRGGKEDLFICYAESTDGIHFTKPILNFHELNGSTANNVVIPSPGEKGIRVGGCAVWIDPKAPPQQRYKTQVKCYPKKIAHKYLHMHASPDGIRWNYMQVCNIGSCDTQTIIFWDDDLQRYMMYTRRNDTEKGRMVRHLESRDLIRWGNEIIVMKADDVDLATHEVPESAGLDYYGGAVFKYPSKGGGVYVMLAQAYWHWLRPGWRPAGIDVRLAVSRDGRNFKRLGGRKPFLRFGPAGSFYSGMIYAMPNPIRMGDELWIYYVGTNADHSARVDPAASRHLSGISRAVMRLDGFVSADADYTGGEITTPLIRFEGETLELNLDTSGGGLVLVELLDAEGRPVKGHTKADATPLLGNSVRMPVSWGETASVGSLAGKPIKIHFIMQDCKLYAFQFRR